MAGVRFAAVTGEIATGTATKTLLQIVAAANQRVLIAEWDIGFKGVTNSDAPILFEIVRQTNAGTMSALTLRKWIPSDDETIQASAQHTATGEPTSTDVVFSTLIHPQSGRAEQHRFSEELVVPGGTRIGFRVTAGASVNAVVSVLASE